MEKYTVQLRLTGEGTFGQQKMSTPLQSVTVEGTGRTFKDAVNQASAKLSALLNTA